jgi:hypothetical protein
MRRTGGEEDFEDFWYERGLPMWSPKVPNIPMVHPQPPAEKWFALNPTAKDILSRQFGNTFWPSEERINIANALLCLEKMTDMQEKVGTEDYVANYMAFFLALTRMGFIQYHTLRSPAKYWSIVRPTQYALALQDAETSEIWVFDARTDAGYCPFTFWKPAWL